MLVVHLIVHVLYSGDTAHTVVSGNTYDYNLNISSVDGVTMKEKALVLEEVTLTERVLMFGGVGLAIAVFFVATVVAGRIIHSHGWQKGWATAKHSSSIQHKSDK